MFVRTQIGKWRARAKGSFKATLLVFPLLLCACAHHNDHSRPANRSEYSAVPVGPYTYNPATRGFERPWPFGPAHRY